MILEISKSYCDKFYSGDIKKVIEEKDGILWTPERIRAAFSGGYGTEKDLKRYMNDNKQYVIFVEI